MITFSRLNKLGQNGSEQGLGNQLFQYFFTRLVAEKNNYQFGVSEWKGRYIFKDFDHDCYPQNIQTTFTENFSIDPQAYPYYDYNQFTDSTDFYGYFLNHRYYTQNKDYIFENLKLSDEFQEELTDVLKGYSKHKHLVSIHLRIGDFLIFPNDFVPVLSNKYYTDAIQKIYKQLNTKDVHFIVCSDESEETLLKNYEFLRNIEYTYQRNHVAIDLFTMVSCEAHILANSTLSWWVGFLGKDGYCVYYKNWAHRDWTYPSELACPEWDGIYKESYCINKESFIR